MLADQVDVVVGVDTHRDRHALAALSARSGGVLYETRIAAATEGYEKALALVARHCPGRRAWAVEGTGSYGAGLSRYLLARGERVIEIDRPCRRGERTEPKTTPWTPGARPAARSGARSSPARGPPACGRPFGP
jgi:transposase